ncbi:unnamed protein product, partial [Rangifer tarandus platyrhynchus]
MTLQNCGKSLYFRDRLTLRRETHSASPQADYCVHFRLIAPAEEALSLRCVTA